MIRILTSLIIIFLLWSCSGPTLAPQAPNLLTPYQAIQEAAAKPEGIDGTFKVIVKNIGNDRGTIFLNSELDYRDQRCLNVSLSPMVVTELNAKFGFDSIEKLKNRTIHVKGNAKRVTIHFIANGRITEKYYYQTQIRVTEPDQIALIP